MNKMINLCSLEFSDLNSPEYICSDSSSETLVNSSNIMIYLDLYLKKILLYDLYDLNKLNQLYTGFNNSPIQRRPSSNYLQVFFSNYVTLTPKIFMTTCKLVLQKTTKEHVHCFSFKEYMSTEYVCNVSKKK